MSEDIDVPLAERGVARAETYAVAVHRYTDADGGFADGYVRGLRSREDVVYRILDGSRG